MLIIKKKRYFLISSAVRLSGQSHLLPAGPTPETPNPPHSPSRPSAPGTPKLTGLAQLQLNKKGIASVKTQFTNMTSPLPWLEI